MDTSIFINASQPEEKGAQASMTLLSKIKAGKLQSVISTITVAELLNGAYRLGHDTAVRMKRDFEAYRLTGSIIAPLTENIADKIGELCAKHNTRIRPDVIIVASALLTAATAVVTRDVEHFSKFKREVQILEPEDILKMKA